MRGSKVGMRRGDRRAAGDAGSSLLVAGLVAATTALTVKVLGLARRQRQVEDLIRERAVDKALDVLRAARPQDPASRPRRPGGHLRIAR